MGKKQPSVTIATSDDADRALQRIGELERYIAGAGQDAEERIDVIRTKLSDQTEVQVALLKETKAALEAWAKKDAKTWIGKTLALLWGSISWRTPPKRIVVKLDEETVIERLRARKMLTCIRTKEEIDKEALENYSDEIIAAVGCERKQGKDKFYYELKREEVK